MICKYSSGKAISQGTETQTASWAIRFECSSIKIMTSNIFPAKAAISKWHVNICARRSLHLWVSSLHRQPLFLDVSNLPTAAVARFQQGFGAPLHRTRGFKNCSLREDSVLKCECPRGKEFEDGKMLSH